MGRPRAVSDEAILDDALRLLRAVGPDKLSFGLLARRVDLAGSTLVQRFGTKPDLVRGALERAWDQLESATGDAVDQAADGVDGVVDLLVRLTGRYDDEPADQLLLLREDLRDPVLRARGVAWLDRLAGAVDDRLAPTGLGGCGDLVVAAWQGTVIQWSFRQDGPPAQAVERSLRRLLDRLVAGDRTPRAERRPSRRR